MSVLGYLQNTASSAVLTDDERKSISTSVTTLSTRLDSYFKREGDKLSGHFQFGSSTRATILPRSMDANSDIDYMIVFEKGGLKPQAYLERLKRFAEQHYGTSEIYQSSPSVVLELNHIKFDLVPALHQYSTTYYIPNGSSDWQATNPNDFNGALEQKNKAESYLLKPTIRLAKAWNAANGYVFDSYVFEKWIKDLIFIFCFNQKDYLFKVFDSLSTYQQTQTAADKITRAKGLVNKVRDYERESKLVEAYAEIKKLIPT